MTATADIIARKLTNTLLVPNAALRFAPAAGAKSKGGITSSILPGRRIRSGGAGQEASFGTGSTQTIYVEDEQGQPRPVKVVIGESDGNMTAITGGDLKAGMNVITGQLSASSGGK